MVNAWLNMPNCLPTVQVAMMAAGVLFLMGAGLQAGASNLAMLICGRMVLGCGVGTAAVTVPV